LLRKKIPHHSCAELLCVTHSAAVRLTCVQSSQGKHLSLRQLSLSHPDVGGCGKALALFCSSGLICVWDSLCCVCKAAIVSRQQRCWQGGKVIHKSI
jgi:hypothetical protein